jgi:hypothetical protein
MHLSSFNESWTRFSKGTDFLKCYIDDVLVNSKGLFWHLAHLEELFKRLHKVNMKIHPKKCEFVITLVIYFGHRILPNGIMVHWAKVVAIFEMLNPIDVHILKNFIRLCNYYRIYVQDFITITHCRAPKSLVDPLEGPSMRQCGSGWNLGHNPDF